MFKYSTGDYKGIFTEQHTRRLKLFRLQFSTGMVRCSGEGRTGSKNRVKVEGFTKLRDASRVIASETQRVRRQFQSCMRLCFCHSLGHG